MWNLSILIIFLSWKLGLLSQRHVTCSQSLWVSQRRKWLVNHSLSFFLFFSLHVYVFVYTISVDGFCLELKFAAFFQFSLAILILKMFSGRRIQKSFGFWMFFLKKQYWILAWKILTEDVLQMEFPLQVCSLGMLYKELNFKFCRFCKTGLPSDITVVVDDVKFHLHKV